jgi:hypothetical protein
MVNSSLVDNSSNSIQDKFCLLVIVLLLLNVRINLMN